jgi:hypothetical protein
MTNTQIQERRSRVRIPRRLRWALLIGGAIAATLVALYAYIEYRDAKELQDAIAAADRLDPGWRFEDLEAARAAVPDAENGAIVVLAARALLPAQWPPAMPAGVPGLADRLADLPPPQRPDPALLNELRNELTKVAPAIDKARELADRPRGRYDVKWNEDHIGTLLPHVHQLRTVVELLTLDAALRANRGDMEDAMRSCRAALNTGRSLGDEPFGLSQLIRAHCALIAVRALERTLAAGTVSPKALHELQELLADEAAVPAMLMAGRDLRVSFFEPLDRMRTGRFDATVYKIKPSFLGTTGDGLIDSSQARACEAAYLRYTNAVVEIAKLPSAEQEKRLEELAQPTQPLPKLLAALTGGSDWVRLARTFNRRQAEMRCATAALAAERYRLKEGHWPDRLDALVPHYLAAVPLDPMDAQPLRWRRLPDGVVVYAIGPDRRDHDGKLDRKQPGTPGSDFGFQLWDPGRRGVVAAP